MRSRYCSMNALTSDGVDRARPRKNTEAALRISFAVTPEAGMLQIADATISHGTLVSQAGDRLTIQASILGATPSERTLTIPSSARIERNAARATLVDLRRGDEVNVVQGPYGTYLAARDPEHQINNHGDERIIPLLPSGF